MANTPLSDFLTIIFSTSKMWKCPPLFPRAQGDTFKLRVLPEQQSKIQIYSIFNYIKQKKKQQILTFEEPAPTNVKHLCLINDFMPK